MPSADPSAVVLELPARALVLLAGAGVDAFAARWLAPDERVDLAALRRQLGGDGARHADADLFTVARALIDVRLRRGRLTAVDAGALGTDDQRALVALARRHRTPCVTVALAPDGADALPALADDGVEWRVVLRGDAAIAGAVVTRGRSRWDRRDHHGPFDLVGDVHGCRSELDALLAKLGWVEVDGVPRHPEGRTAVFLGDLVDRGPDSPGVLRRVMAMVRAGVALCVPGNHDVRLVRALRGGKTGGSHGLALTLDQLAPEPAAFREEVAAFVDALPTHLLLDGGRLVAAHAGCAEEHQGTDTGAARSFCLYGDTTGELDGYGLPVRADWARTYRGAAKVVHGHVPVARTSWVNGVIDIDTGCVFGGRLTALRWPEEELVDVPAEREWFAPTKPLG